MARAADIVVVKIGGSLLGTDRLASVLAICARARVPLVVVPGGGPFADEVRLQQKRLDFPDDRAHRMAILAMHQTAQVLQAIEPRLVACETKKALQDAFAAGDPALWLPFKIAARDRTIPANWSITSDGLAARLAELIGASAVYLVKEVNIAAGADLARLAADGVIDAMLPKIVERAKLGWRLFGPGEEAALAAALRAPTKPRDEGRRR